MRRPNLDNLPAIPSLPAGYILRKGTPDDAQSMGEMMSVAYNEPWDADRCLNELLANDMVSPTFVIEHEGQIVATASCKNLVPPLEHAGYLHYVGAYPQRSGKGLGTTVVLAVLHEFRQTGRTESILNTDDFRLPAIWTYLKLGYVPVYEDDEHITRWSAIFQALMSRSNAS